MMAENDTGQGESTLGTILGWGGLALFSIAFAWYVGAPLLVGERWSDKQNDAIELVRGSKPTGSDTLYDLTRAYSLKAHERDLYIGEFNWSALQREGPEYEVTLLWTEGSEHKAALWRVNLKTREIRPQGDEASNLVRRLTVSPGKS